MPRITKNEAIELMSKHGIPAGKDFHALSSDEVRSVIKAADDRGYVEPKGASGSRARYFYAYLSKVVGSGAVRSEEPAAYAPAPVFMPAAGMTIVEQEDEIIASALAILEARVRYAHKIGSPAEMREYLTVLLGGEQAEVFHVVFLTNQHQVITSEPMFYGTIDQCAVYPRQIAKRALELNAGAVVLAHNHPSGHPEPSAADRHITKRIQETLGMFDVRVLDHMVVGGGKSVSFAEKGWI